MRTEKAKESPQITRAREKVKAHIQEENKLITPQALKEMDKTIHHWLKRHDTERVNLKSKKISHTEKPHSKHVLHLQKMLQHELAKKQTGRSLKGRVKNNKK